MTTTYHKEHLLDRAAMLAMRAILAVQPKLEFGPEARPGFDELIAKTPAAAFVTYEAATMGGVAGWWCKPEQVIEGCAIVYLHGGAYILGSAAAYRNFVGQIAARAKVAIFIVDYGTAPEQTFPSAVKDAEAVYRNLSEAGFLRLAIAGDSAGGGLALVLLLLMVAASKSSSIIKPAAAAVMSPWTDLAATGKSMEHRAKSDPLLTRDALQKAAELYMGAHDRKDPQASPLYADFTAVPPILFHVGEGEILLDDSCRAAEKIEAAGGNAEIHIWEGMTHVFLSNLSLQAAQEAVDGVGEFLRSHLKVDSH
jgi:monoterpene epsilon-lactone hydrolase